MEKGLPHYVEMDRKPAHGSELKTVSCRKSGIILRIETVVSPERIRMKDFKANSLHETAVTLRLVEPWFESRRVVCADSFFASVETANALFGKGLGFTGVIKNSTRGYPMNYMSHLEISRKYKHVAMVSNPENRPQLMAVTWVDRDRRYFISYTGTTNPGTPIFRERWRTRNDVTRKEEISIDNPQVCEKNYDTCSQIDRHNRCRQDNLDLEKKFEVKEWSMGVNSSLLAICIVHAWNCTAVERETVIR